MSHYEVNLFAIGLLLILLVSMHLRKELVTFATRFFRLLIITTITVLAFEYISFSVDGKEGEFFYVLNYASNFLIVLLAPAIIGIWVSYIDFKVHASYERIKKRFFYMHAFSLGVILSVINMFYPIIYHIDSTNVYHRDILIWFNMGTSFLILTYAFYMALAYRKQINRNLVITVVSFSFLPLIAAIIQLNTTDIALIWSVTSLGIVLIYVMLETQSYSIDYLTGLYTRVKLDEYIRRLVRKEIEFCIIMIDLDDYKLINDTKGHLIGDKVLVKFGHILKDVFNNGGLVSRYGGDEFTIVMLETKDNIIKAYIEQVKESISRSNDELLSLVKFSAGYSKKTKDNNKSFEELFIESDNSMYMNKAENKNQNRRKSDK